MIQAGAFDGLGDNRPTLLANMEGAVKHTLKRKESSAFGQVSLFGAEEEAAMDTFAMEEVEDSTLLEKLEKEKQLLGFYVSGHPMDMYRETWQKCVNVDIGQQERLPLSRTVNLVAMVTDLKEIITKGGAGERMAFLQLTDFNGSVEAVVFPDVWNKRSLDLRVDAIFGFKGKFERRQQRLSFVVEEIVEAESLEPNGVKEVHIELIKSLCSDEVLRLILDTCITHKGNCSLYLHLIDEKRKENNNNGTPSKRETLIKAGSDFNVAYSEKLIKELEELQAVSEIWYT